MLKAATNIVDVYNEYVTKQQGLAADIDEAIAVLVDRIATKELLAAQQKALHVYALPTLSPIGIRHALQQDLTQRLEGSVVTQPFSTQDWSTKRMLSAAGDLE